MESWALLAPLWAQATPGTDPNALPLLALRRWYASLTLSSPDPAPSQIGLEAWLLGLLALLVVAIVLQGPRRALRQFFDLPGHVRLLGAALSRFRKAGRLVATLLGITVLSWTLSQFLHYNSPARLDDLLVLERTKSAGELAYEHGALAALVPFRDLMGLGDTLLLLVTGTIIVFKLSADRWNDATSPDRPSVPPWTTLCWGSAWLYAMYRFASMVIDTGGLPLGGCLFVEALIVPLLMAMSDGLLLAWALVELRNAGLSEVGAERFDPRGALGIWPAATLSCMIGLPARYVATGTFLLLYNIPSLASLPLLLSIINGWGLVVIQGAALLTVVTAGAAAWNWGCFRGVLQGYLAMLRAEGGRLVAALALSGLAAGGCAALAYGVVLSLPAQPWVLAAADSYAHYATLPVGLVAMAAMIELGGRALPRADLGAVSVVEDEAPALQMVKD